MNGNRDSGGNLAPMRREAGPGQGSKKKWTVRAFRRGTVPGESHASPVLPALPPELRFGPFMMQALRPGRQGGFSIPKPAAQLALAGVGEAAPPA